MKMPNKIKLTGSHPFCSLDRRIRLQDFKYVLILFRDLSWNSGNWRSHASRIAWILSLGCLDIGTIRSKFSSTNNLTNIWKQIMCTTCLKFLNLLVNNESRIFSYNYCKECLEFFVNRLVFKCFRIIFVAMVFIIARFETKYLRKRTRGESRNKQERKQSSNLNPVSLGCLFFKGANNRSLCTYFDVLKRR